MEDDIELLAKSAGASWDTTDEVARLRGLLKDHATFLRKNGFDRQADNLMRHAASPEEPTVKESLPVEPEWRELGPDEVIQRGDERIEYPHGLEWRMAKNSIGTMAGRWSTLKFRTRRPKPVESDGLKNQEKP